MVTPITISITLTITAMDIPGIATVILSAHPGAHTFGGASIAIAVITRVPILLWAMTVVVTIAAAHIRPSYDLPDILYQTL